MENGEEVQTETEKTEEAVHVPSPDEYLAVQDISRLNPSTLTPLTPEVISRQATINIGMH